ncbi:MAG: HU family DNA-binding protein [Desulfovibrio sp.]|nr:HU family DNA-binding protein [Desulfovibrio sp.]
MQKTLTKADIIDAVLSTSSRKRREVKVIVEKLMEIMCDSLQKDHEVLLTGFGKFECYSKSARIGRNPHTEEALLLPPRKVVVFRVSRLFRKELNP